MKILLAYLDINTFAFFGRSAIITRGADLRDVTLARRHEEAMTRGIEEYWSNILIKDDVAPKVHVEELEHSDGWTSGE